VQALLRSLTSRLRRANHQLATLAIVDGYGRAARAILDMARETGKLASNIGTTRDTVTRMLADLKKEGLLLARKDHLVVTPAFEKAFD
jgi:CRP/FNR family transcriptional regulator/CRP/FNR family cyclic AMP-dependent transcriptional regulator